MYEVGNLTIPEFHQKMYWNMSLAHSCWDNKLVG